MCNVKSIPNSETSGVNMRSDRMGYGHKLLWNIQHENNSMFIWSILKHLTVYTEHKQRYDNFINMSFAI